MARVDEPPHPPGEYDVVVVGSGPGGLQTSYCLKRLGVRHAVLSADDAPGGMFRRFPLLGRLISWTTLDAPWERPTREYEWYDWNSLLADEPEHRALITEFLDDEDRRLELPSREAMATGLAAYAERTGLTVRYSCRWESTVTEDERVRVETSDGVYRCRAAVFATGVAEPWKPPIRGIEDVPHYADAGPPSAYRGKRVFVVGKGDAAFELAGGLLDSATELVLASPDPVRPATRSRVAFPIRDLEAEAHSRPGPACVNASIDSIERRGSGYRVRAMPTSGEDVIDFDVDEVIAATGFRTPLGDLPARGLTVVADGRIPALTPFWESVSLRGIYFAGNASQGAPGLRKQGLFPASVSVGGHRYNARLLAAHLAETHFGVRPERRLVRPEDVVPYLVAELAHAPELWIQMGYLTRVLSVRADGIRDEGILQLEHFVDEVGPDAVAVTIELDAEGATQPVVYVRCGGELAEHALAPHPAHAYEGEEYRREVAEVLKPLLR